MIFSRPLIRWLLGPLLATLLAAAEPPKPAQDFAAGGTPPKVVKRDPPQYPYNMRRAGLAGRVVMEFVIDEDGAVQNPVVVRSNNPWFERPAIVAVLKWKFHAAEMGGKKVSTRASQMLEFNPDWRTADTSGLWYVPRLKHPEELPPALRWATAPEPVGTAFPVYPFPALQAGLTGSTEIKFIVGPDGRIVGSQILSATQPEMGLAALAMIDAWRFTSPKNKEGVPCHAALSMKHDFKRSNDSDAPVSDEAREILKMLEKKPGEILNADDLDHALKPLSRRPPVYPTKLLETGRTGEAMIEFFIDRQGDAQLPHIISSTEPEFGYAAAQAVATWRFEAPVKAGKPATARVRIPIHFNLQKLE